MDLSLDYNKLIRRADWNAAYDASMAHVKEHPNDIDAQHAAVFCLVRAGSLEQARKQYNEFNLDEYTDHEDIVALGGRILKGLMLEADRDQRGELCTAAQARYRQAYEIKKGTYPGINTATLAFLNDDFETSAQLAGSILSDLKSSQAQDETPIYYQHATRAEAYLLLGDISGCERALDAAVASDPENFAARASTLKQLELILVHMGKSGLETLSRWRPRPIIHFTGHIFSHHKLPQIRHLDSDGETHLAVKISATLSEYNISEGYGALAAGSDVIIAEQLLERGADLHIVLPSPLDEFKANSVTPFGNEWGERFDSCIRKAQSVRITNKEPGKFDDLALGISSHIAMGLATLRSKALGASVYQLAIWDKGPAGMAGTGADCKIWDMANRERILIKWPGSPPPARLDKTQPHSMFRREFRGMLFTDIVGFGKLPDSALPELIRSVFHPLAKICRDLPDPPDLIDTWGDGIFLTFTSVDGAGHAALALQQAFRQLASKLSGSLEGLSLRIGGHCGPVYIGNDPFLQKPNTYGRNVVIASRIEPMTLPGAVYVSEPFACMLDASHPDKFQCEYIGTLHSNKEDLPLPLFSLRGGIRN